MAHSNKLARANGKGAAIVAIGRLGLVAHAIAICLLAYLASSRLVDVTGVLLHRMGMKDTDAVMAASMAGFLYLWVILMWAFAQRSIARAWLSVGGLAGAAMAAAWMAGEMA